MHLDHDVLVIGGGVVGLAAALSMAARGFTVAVIDAGTLQVDALATVTDARVYAINQASQALLEQLGVWSLLEVSRLSFYQYMHVWDAANGAHIDFDSRTVAAPYLGTIIEEAVLKKGLVQRIAQHPEIQLYAQCTIEQIQITDAVVRVNSAEQTWQGQLLLVADGANSMARQKLNVGLTSWSYQQDALVATVGVEKAHQNTAYQVFNADGPLAFLPLADPHQCSIVWSTEPKRAQRLKTAAATDFNLELRNAFARKLGEVQLLSPRHQFPLLMRHATAYAGNRWLLMGDAAHTIHPLAGLGLNLGLADVAAWGDCLDKARGQLNSRKALGAYQRQRKASVWQAIALMEGFKRLFSYSASPVVSLRKFGLGFCNDFNLIKRLFIEHARGLD